jgi:16S rRNA (guanine1207-N2)-methyltransferase
MLKKDSNPRKSVDDNEESENVIRMIWKDKQLIFETDAALFSPRYPDPGTLFMMENVDFSAVDKVLDLGCGYGLVGVIAAMTVPAEKIFMTDNDPRAVECSRRNLERNGIRGATVELGNSFEATEETGFSMILSNPPYHADFSVAKSFIEKGFNRLSIGGKMIMVTKRKEWYKNKLIAIFGGVRILEKDGYLLFISEKRAQTYAKKK